MEKSQEAAACEGDNEYRESTAISAHGLDLCLLIIFAYKSENLYLRIPRNEYCKYRPDKVERQHNRVARELGNNKADRACAYKTDGHKLEGAELIRQISAREIQNGRCNAENGKQKAKLCISKACCRLECDIVACVRIDH